MHKWLSIKGNWSKRLRKSHKQKLSSHKPTVKFYKRRHDSRRQTQIKSRQISTYRNIVRLPSKKPLRNKTSTMLYRRMSLRKRKLMLSAPASKRRVRSRLTRTHKSARQKRESHPRKASSRTPGQRQKRRRSI